MNGATFMTKHRAALAALPALLMLAAPVAAHPGLHHDIEALSARIAAQPDDPALRLERAVYHRLNGEPDLALADLEAARRGDPGNPALLLERGLTLSAAGRDREAMESLDAYLGREPRSAYALTERARLRARAGRVSPAIADYTAAIAVLPELDSYLERGALQEKAGRLDDAARGYRDGLDRLGGAVLLAERLIQVDVQRGHGHDALATIDAAMAHASVKTAWMLRRADVLARLGRSAEADAARRSALEEADRVLAGRDSSIHRVSRARALAALGRTGEARVELDNVLARTPAYEEARALRDSLATDGSVARGRR